MELETIVTGGFVIAFAVAVVCCIACCFKSSGVKRSEHDARMAEYANKAIEHDARMEDFSRKAEKHEWERAKEVRDARASDEKSEADAVRLQILNVQLQQEVLKLQKELAYKEEHPEKFKELDS